MTLLLCLVKLAGSSISFWSDVFKGCKCL